MSKWMSIGFDPEQMDPVTEPHTLPAISGARDGDAAPRQTAVSTRRRPANSEPSAA
jgi:hypothetical protein